MSFDDDAAGDGAGFRPPPHPDDRLWRHPSEVAGACQAELAPRPRARWPWGIVVAVGTVGVVALTLGGALVLGLRTQPGDGDQGGEMAATTAVTPSSLVEPAWLGIEGYDQLAAAGATSSTSSAPEATEPTDGAPGTTGDLDGEPPDHDADAGAGTESPAPESSTTLEESVDQAGVVITSVDPDGPAAQALQPGDVVLEVDGEPVTDMETLLETLGSYEPGDQVEITYMTSDTGEVETSTAVVTLGARPEDLTVEGDDGQ